MGPTVSVPSACRAPAPFGRVILVMRRAQFLRLLGWAGFSLACQALPARSSSAPARSSLPSPVRVRDWARAQGLTVRWLETHRRLQLTKGGLQLVLQANSREAFINGVRVYLLCPFEYLNPAGYLAEVDVQRTFGPFLEPPRLPQKQRMEHICLDPGHGGKDTGYRIGTTEEKRLTLALAQELAGLLRQAGFRVTLTRTRDVYLDLEERPRLAQRAGADLFVSLHFNAAAAGAGQVRGVETYCLTPANASSTANPGRISVAGPFPGNQHDLFNIRLAYALHQAMVRGLPSEDRGLRRARFAVLREASMPAALVEAGFLSHPVEGRRINDPAYRRRIAQELARGLQAYLELVHRP